MKLLFGFFMDDMSYPASILSSLAINKGWEVEFLFVDNNTNDLEIEERIVEGKADLVALTFKTFERNKAFQVAKIAKALGVKIVGGGSHPSACPQDVVSSGLFDGVVVGDGMGVFEEILESFNSLKGEIITGRKHQDITAYTKRFFSESQKERIKKSKELDVFTSLGCPFSCHFCANNKGFMKLPIKAVVDEIVKARELFAIENISIKDDTFTYSKARIREFQKLIEENGITLNYPTVSTRVNTFSDEIAEELVALGVESIYFGIETASPKLLKFLNKQATAEEAYRAAAICKKHGLAFKASLLFGVPTQDKEDYEATLDFVKEVKPALMTIFYFVPFPGSHMFDYCIENGYMPDDYSFDNYLSIDPNSSNFKGIRENTGKLKKIDYEMATEYMDKIRNIEQQTRDSIIIKTAHLADETKWILFGTSHYFNCVLESLSNTQWKNCLGYYDYNESAFKHREFSINIPKYNWNDAREEPETVVVTTHNGMMFNKIISPLLKDKFKGRILSVATYGKGFN